MRNCTACTTRWFSDRAGGPLPQRRHYPSRTQRSIRCFRRQPLPAERQLRSSGQHPRTPTRDRDPATARAVLRDIPISAKKLAMWTDVVRRKHIDDAIVQCEMAHKKAAKICLKVRTFLLHLSAMQTASHKHKLMPCASVHALAAPHPSCHKGPEVQLWGK